MRIFFMLIAFMFAGTVAAQDSKITNIDEYLRIQADYDKLKKSVERNRFLLEIQKGNLDHMRKWYGKEVEGDLVFLSATELSTGVMVCLKDPDGESMLLGFLPRDRMKELESLKSGDKVSVIGRIRFASLTVTRISKK